jgi:hypothetical protein
LESKKAVSLILSALILATSITMPSLTVKATTVKGSEQVISSKIAEEGQPTINDGQTNPPTGEEIGTPVGGEEQGGNTGSGEQTPPKEEEKLEISLKDISTAVNIDKKNAKVSFTVNIENNPDENSGKRYIKEVFVIYKNLNGGGGGFKTILQKSSDDPNAFSGYTEGPYFPNGQYAIDEIVLNYNDDFGTYLPRAWYPQMKNGDFAIDIDREAPAATGFYITNTVVRTNENFKVRINANDNKGLKTVAVVFQIPGTNEVTAVEVPYYGYGDQYEVDLYFEEGLPYGNWRVLGIYLEDNAENVQYYLNNNERIDPILKDASVQYVKAINSGWNNFNGSWYYYQPKGLVQHHGWLSYNGNWYYLNKNGVMETGWVTDNGRKYFMNASGAMATGWVSSGGKWYYMSGNGSITTGWVYNNNKWYYLGTDGTMYTGWVLYKGGWYYLEYSGAMKTGWANSGGTWYYLGNSGKMITGWVQAGGKWYYMYENGAMAVNTVIQGYKIGASGAWIK